MKKDGYYSSGEFARMAHVTLRTVRYYDKQDILKPSLVTESGARFYTDEDFARLQQILLLKYLGFSLDDIREMTIGDSDYHFMLNSLNIQLRLVRDRIEQMQLVEKAIQDTAQVIKEQHTIDWSQMLNLIHLTGMEKSLKNQYQNATNISSRINLHSLYSQNKQGWFPWIFEQCRISPGLRILELGCGDGTLWTDNLSLLPEDISITLSDISSGMLRDARRAIGSSDTRFAFRAFDCRKIPCKDESFDLVIANHVLFYCDDIPSVLKEVRRVLAPGGRFLCSAYGKAHMQEVSQLVLTDCVTYSANDDDLQACGLDSPELIIEVAYDGEDGASGTFTLNVSRDPDERAAEAPADGESEEEITAYARVGQSKLLYQITGAEYEALMAASYDALRHQEVLPAALEDISQVDMTLEGETYTLTAADSADGPAFAYQGETLESNDFQSALQALTAVSFTDEAPTGKEEIALTLHLEGEGSPTVQIALYRFDGENCLATLDGKPLCLVERSAAVALIEAVHAIVLN